MNITAAVVPVRSAPFEIETLDLAAPLADEVLVRVVASGMCHTDLHARIVSVPARSNRAAAAPTARSR
jgi:aryl-alcohol dehydrogenase